MSRFLLISSVTSAVAALGVQVPTASAEGKRHSEPAWCKGADLFGSASLDDALAKKDPRDALYGLAMIMCEDGHRGDDVEARWSELEVSRAYWSKRLAMNEADWADVPVWAAEDAGSRGSPAIQYDKKRGLASLDAIEQYGLLGEYSFLDRHYFADALGGRLSATGRASYVQGCLASKKVGEWAICHPDVLAFDGKKALEEVRGATARTPYERIAVRTLIDLTAQAIPARLAEVKALAAADPAYAKLFGIAADVHTRWAKRKDEGLDLAFAMDDARLTKSRKAVEGCVDTTWKGVAAAVADVPAKRFADVIDDPQRDFLQKAVSILADDDDFYLAASAYAICAGESDQVDYLARAIGSALKYLPGQRGPRTAAHTIMLTSGIELDDRSASIEYPAFKRDWFEESSLSGGVKGVVGSIKAEGDQMRVTFAAKKAKYRECATWKPLPRIIRIDADGTVIRDSVCTKYEVNTYNIAPEPQTIHPRYATGIKAGTFVSISQGVAMGVWAKDSESIPIAVFGVAVK